MRAYLPGYGYLIHSLCYFTGLTGEIITLSHNMSVVAASAVAFRAVSENSGSLLCPQSVRSPSTIYSAPSQEACNPLVTSQRLRMSVGVNNQLSYGSPDRLPFEYAIKTGCL
ncbi:hypothetical protein EVAR_29990_1 [Eumeta japonica]|uniref:Uncharacterized protein n=1 Tax=Eumeta variegata TaxID=151549 RepID=A0A4C1VF92_EUMVA|nr:hypothetical protein EVAR_29990_1 [Eumeta japonica]